MSTRKRDAGLSIVEREYLRLLRPELRRAIKEGEPERAASFAKEIARLERKRHSRKRADNGC